MKMMKIYALGVVIILAALGVTASAQGTGTLSAKAAAEIIAPFTITDNSGLAGGTTLNFGRMTISPTLSGTCVLSTANVRTLSGGLSEVASTTTTASFAVSGKPGATYAITLPVSLDIVSTTNPAEKMTVNSFRALPVSSSTGDAVVGTLDLAGADSFTIGATLNVDANQAEGIYEGTFNVTAAYN